MQETIIRNETPADYAEVENLIREAFWDLNMPCCSEHYLAHILRSHEDLIPELDLVAEADGKIVGSIMYTKSKLIGDDGTEKDILTFGPLAVLPQFQRQGYGKMLLEHSFKIAADMGYDVIVIFGSPANYVCRGFKSCRRFNVCLDNDYFPTAMLVKELKEGALDGRKYIYRESSAYEFDPAEAEEFDKHFPPKEKNILPCQEEFYIYSHSSVHE
ncbi:MAG: N-acetyltransferase [Oscillospiraceae bacterium]|nr:N-acetyltransferase [Oscillospiraceae bacterium]